MKKILSLLLIVALMALCFFLGRFTAPQIPSQTFYARIAQKSGDHLIVEGIPENDVNHRGRFQFSLEGVKLSWRYTEIAGEDLDEGDLIAISYTGTVAEISPAIIYEVLEIQLLDDQR